MTALRRDNNPIEELQFALAEAEAQPPPRGLGESVLDAALSARTAGRPVDEPPPITAVEGFRRAVASFDALLASLDDEDWHRPAVRDLDVQGLVGHLTGVEHDFLDGMRDPDGAQAQANHVASTDPMAAAQQGRPSSETYDEWRATVAETLDAVTELDATATKTETETETRLGGMAALHSLRMPLASLLVARAFELWTHEEDIRRATGRDLQAPDAATLRLMTDLGMALVPAAMAHSNRSHDRRWARIVLTGPGGGTWQTALDPVASTVSPEGPLDVRIVLDAVEFCRLVANRVDPATLQAVVTGDGALASDLFASVATLALD
jgi:uncharacterized protein (TIGR03083 family)